MYSKHSFYILSCLPLLALLASYSATHIYMNRGSIKTPNLLGIDLLQAAELLAPVKLNVRVLGNKIEPDLPIGTILHQHPLPSTAIKENQTVFVVTSLQPESVKMPSLIGFTKQEADDLISPLGIRKKYVYTTSNHPKSTCFAQFPSPQSSITGCELIIILIAQDNRPLLVPDLRGLSVYEASELLNMHDMQMTVSHREQLPLEHTCLTNCHIVHQNPAPGTMFIKTGNQPPSLALEAIFSDRKHGFL